MTDEEEPGYGLVMPFIACETQGGAYGDVAFVAGYAGGHLDAELGLLRAGERELYAPPALVAQLDLIAMRHGWVLTATPHNEEWTLCHFRRAPDATLGDRVCHECGARNPCWYADSDWWNEVVGQDREVVLCPTCFLVRAETASCVVRISRPPCCRWHSATCEPPSELCCENCSEREHPRHPNTDCVLKAADGSTSEDRDA